MDTRKKVIFGGLGVGITNAKKAEEWQHVADTVNNVASEGRTFAEMKKKWSDIRVKMKKRIALHRKSVCATGWGKGTPELTPMEEKLAGIGESLLSGVVTEAGETDAPEPPNVPDALIILFSCLEL